MRARLLVWVVLVPLLSGLLGSAARAQDRGSSVPVPPYPGPVPTSWATVADYETYAEQRAEQLKARQNALMETGRPQHYQLKRGLLLATLFLGTAVAVSSFVVLWTRAADPEHTRETVSRGAFGAMLAGASAALASGFGARALSNRNLNNDEIEQLRQERRYWVHEVRRVKRERTKPTFDVSWSGAGFAF